MKRAIRFKVFETNSSAMHNIVILSEDDYNKWSMDDNLYTLKDKIWYWESEKGLLPPEKGKLYTKEEIIKNFYDGDIANEDYSIDEWIADQGFVTAGQWDDLELEQDSEKFVSPSGDKMVACCAYGYDY